MSNAYSLNGILKLASVKRLLLRTFVQRVDRLWQYVIRMTAKGLGASRSRSGRKQQKNLHTTELGLRTAASVSKSSQGTI